MSTEASESKGSFRAGLYALAIPAIMTAIALGAAYSEREKTNYYAHTLLRLSPRHPKIIFTTNEDRPGIDEIQLELMVMMKSRQVMNNALSDSEVVKRELIKGKPDAVAWLASQIQVKALGGGFIEIGMEGDQPQDLPVIVNAVAKAYLNEVVNRDVTLRQKRLDELTKIWATFQRDSKSKRNAIRKLKTNSGSDDKPTLTLMQQYAIENQAMIKREMLEIDAKIRRLEGESEGLLGKPSAKTTDHSEAAKTQEERAAGLKSMIAILSKQKDRLTKEYDLSNEDQTKVIGSNLDLTDMTQAIAFSEQAAKTVGEEIEKVKVELNAPRRVEIYDMAIPPTIKTMPSERNKK